MAKKYVSLSKLSTFLSNLKNTFAPKTHTHKLSDVTDYKVDTALSSASTNPVQNKVLDAEFDAISEAMGALETAIDDKANSSHTHDDRYYTETEVDTKLSGKSDTSHTHSNYVPTSRTVNGKALSSNITLSASDVGALPNTTNIPDALSDLASDSTHRTVTDAEKATWNAKSNFSGSYNDLTNKPTIPSVSGLATETYVDDIASTKVDKVSGKGLSTNDYTTTEKNKLSGIASGAEVNQNAFSNVVVGSTTIAADSKTDSLTIAAGGGISVSGDATNDKVTITNSGVRSIATGSSNGTISVNTNGTSTDVAVKGLGSAAYTASSSYDAKGSAANALTEAKTYTDSVASGKANSSHTHTIANITNLQSTLDGKASSSHTHNAAGSSLGFVKSGGDVTISDGVITIKDDSHNHTIANVDDLTDTLEAKADAVRWTCPTTVGAYSRICELSNYGTGILTLIFDQNSQAVTHTYMVGTAYGMAQLYQIGSNGYSANAAQTVRVVQGSSSTKFYVEVLNNFGYNSTTTVNAKCTYIPLTKNTTCTPYTAYTATNDTVSVRATVDSKYNGIVAPKFYGDLIGNADTASSAVKATQDSSGRNIVNTYATKTETSTVQANLDVVDDKLDSHTSNSDVHVTTSNKSNWNAAYTHSQSTHARTDATKVADSTTNGNILINGSETNVYTHPNSGVTAGTYKSVTVNAQGHITAGTNPTTLAGYGITDAETKGAASSALASAKEYTDSVASGKSNTNHNHDSAYDAKGSASNALASAKTYADSAATTAANKVKNDLLNGAGEAFDTLKELGDLIDDNTDAISALETVAAGKADKSHTHTIANVSGLQSALDGKAASSHGTHVSYSTTAPVMDGTASVGTASTVARSDHKHPTDTSRASKTEFDSHTANTTAHITSTERSNWNAAKTHADSAHAPSNAQPNQNAFSNIKVGSTTVTADSPTDTVTFVGSNVTITPDATNDKVTFAVADGSTSTKGLVQLTNSTSSTSTTTAATPNSVKTAYDLANTAKSAAATAQAAADSKLSLSGGTMTGGIYIPATIDGGINFGGAAGFKTDGYGNFVAGEKALTWNLMDKDGTSKVIVDWATGDTNIRGGLRVAGSINGNASSATKATQDASGNTITSTYATKSELNSAKTSLQSSIDGKSALKSVYDFNVGATQQYLKVCTLTPYVGSNDYNWVKFEVANNTTLFTEVVAYASISQNGVVSHKLQYTGSDLAYGFVYDNGVFEIWVKAINYAKTSIYPKSQFSRSGKITWNFEEADVLPTDAISTVAGTHVQWSGNAATATKLGTSTVGGSSQPIYLNAGTATKVTAVGTAYGGTGATTVAKARTNLDVYSKTEVDTKLSGKSSTSHKHTVSHTPAGTVSKPTFTGSAVNSGTPSGTTSVYSITGVGSVPSLTAAVSNRCLTLSWSAGSVPTRSSVTVASSDHKHSVTASGTVSQPTFTGTAATLTTGTPT